MKTPFPFLLVVLLAVFLQSCNEDDPQKQDEEKEQVEFSFALPALPDDGGRFATDLPEGAELVLSLTNPAGTPIMTNQRFEILNMGGGYITAPIELAPGRYIVTDFLIADGSDILFATPRRGSRLAAAVVRPLPHAFTIVRGRLTNVAMEVLSTTGYVPADFGYVSFSINVVNPLSIAVFTTSVGVTRLATAEAFLYQGATLIDQYSLTATTNLISFRGDPDVSYRLVIRKGGYAEYRREFVYSDLIAELGARALKVFLVPAFTIQTDEATTWMMNLDATGGIITVDWGDGLTNNYDFTSDLNQDVEHTYAAPGEYYISVTGDIDQLTEFYNYYDAGGTASDIHFEHLINLRAVRYGLNEGPALIDLSQNSQLDFINMAGRTDMEDLLLPADHAIDFILINGPNLLNTADVDGIINSIHANAVSKNIHDGVFGLGPNWAEEGGLIGPPSPVAIAQLEELRDVYGWDISEP